MFLNDDNDHLLSAYFVTGIVKCFNGLSYLSLVRIKELGSTIFSHFTDWETEAQSDMITCSSVDSSLTC